MAANRIHLEVNEQNSKNGQVAPFLSGTTPLGRPVSAPLAFHCS
ncbi:hypothetical protein RISK_003157 [Rhodopirellula islandica]|uniref:Uncharacterized protein n=1 Tax=Rhodopirellula islandica TaxID=595434 RepID=A0A0J1EHA2_RHOIS|nr:hypothetical protein RISK_003157 [Rhodopirellula islandica]